MPMQRCAMINARAMGAIPRFIRAEAGARGLARACAVSGLPQGVEKEDARYITQRALMSFIDESARLVGDERLGIKLAQHMTPDDYGVFGTYLLTAPTLLDALERSRRALRWHSTHDEVAIAREGEFVRYSYHFARAGAFGYENTAYCVAGVLVSMIRAYLGANWRPARIELDIPRTRNMNRVVDSFGCDVHPGSRQIAVLIPEHELSTPPVKARSEPAVTLADVERARTRCAPARLSEAVGEVVHLGLLGSSVSLDKVAEELQLGTRTLQRRLEQEGLHFRDIVNRTRVERARALLAERGLSITRIATELGYSAPTHFTRAFQRETGLSPRRYRRAIARSVQQRQASTER